MNIKTPCHEADLIIITAPEGSGHMTSDVPDEIMCEVEGCLNSWDRYGNADEWNK